MSADEDDEQFDESKQGPYIEERHSMSQDVDEVACDYYREHWNVERIFDLEEDSPPENPEDRTAIHYMDYAGVDKLIVTDKMFIFLAQRFRPASNGNDFSIQVDNGTSNPSEYEKYTEAYQSEGNFPGVYGFGNMNKDRTGFEEFVLVDVERFLTMHTAGVLEGEQPYDPKGSSAKYFPLCQLHRHNCIIKSWGTPWENDEYVHPTDGYNGPSPI